MQFLVDLQRLLEEGLFVASYKFSLLVALADLSVETGDDSGAPLSITTEAIATKFIQYYWRQAIPYPSAREGRILKQNTGQQAEILNKLGHAREQYGASVTKLINQPADWNRLVGKVARWSAICVSGSSRRSARSVWISSTKTGITEAQSSCDLV